MGGKLSNRREKKKKKAREKSKSDGWKAVGVDPQVVNTEGLDGFSGLEVWTGPVFGALKKAEPDVDPDGDDVGIPEDKPKSKKKRRRSKKNRKPVEIAEKNEKELTQDDDVPTTNAIQDGEATEEAPKKAKRKRKRKRKPRTKQADENKDEEGKNKNKRRKKSESDKDGAETTPTPPDQAEDEEEFDTSAWDDLDLHPLIMKALGGLKFAHPMPIQSRSIPAAVRDRKDILGAAQTGSGKTLAFGLPIIQMILQERDRPKKKKQATNLPGSIEFQKPDGMSASEEPKHLSNSEDSLELEEILDEDENLESPPQESAPKGTSGGDDMDVDLDLEEASGGDASAGSESELENGIDDAEIAALNKALGISSDKTMEEDMEEDLDLKLDGDEEKRLKALILAPTRELALQVCKHLQAFGKICGVRFVTLVGGMSIQKQERILKGCPEVIVATPGRLWDLIDSGHPHVSDLSGLQVLVIDEADKMVKQGNFVELSKIMSVVPEYRVVETLEAAPPPKKSDKRSKGKKEKVKPPEFVVPDENRQMQTFVFSATLTLPESMHKRLRRGGGGAADGESMENVMEKIRFQKSPEIIDLTGKRGVADGVEEACLPCSEERRDVFLYCLLARYPGRTVVFVNAISSVKRLTAILRLMGIDAQPIHAAKQQKQRLKALDKFTNDANGVLIATDVAARGLDIKDVRCVVHYQVAASADVYIHRCGRTARVDKEGIAISLVVPKEASRFSALFDKLSRPMPVEFPLHASDLFESQKRMDMAVEIDEINRKLDKAKPKDTWLMGVADEIGLDIDPSMLESSKDLSAVEKDRLYAKRSDVMEELRQRLSQPLSQKLNSKFFASSSKSLAAASLVIKNKKDLQKRSKEKAIKLKEREARLLQASNSKQKQKTTPKKDEKEGRKKSKSEKAGAAERSDPASKSHAEMLKARKELSKRKADLMVEEMLNRKVEKGKGRSRRRALGSEYTGKLVVLPTALGREGSGPDALTSLRQAAK
ncbi:hypothetical protein BSKO_03781 [Bryopsis sp. KO-2023]|nr:hypothetical protein BSKO_03781 [Bryopsis sp. KO-2023]